MKFERTLAIDKIKPYDIFLRTENIQKILSQYDYIKVHFAIARFVQSHFFSHQNTSSFLYLTG